MARRIIVDHYARRAKHEHYVSRAVYKLKAIDQKYRLFGPGQRVLDLGCSPGSWLQYLGPRVGLAGLVVGIDRQPPVIDIAPPLYFIAGDLEELNLDQVKALSADFDAVLSDLAPATSGIRDVDHQRSMHLARLAWYWAQELLRPGGHFLVKVFEGLDFAELVKQVRSHFTRTHIVKPAASRSESREIYLLGWRRR
ncbi:MAG: RlmE family RNA methyltransferase [Deltaproteobacteria bacterium]|nr:RlmE family RNA methyltransferase [Deltaproteobacteria bacterium]MBW1952987.1 RlmE family RNA methyltransferase [Deltaproteobacteria bacterium]MBW1985954.1 RlmE family RNA methyltransferase [Deltaproteobacteria bacterium]MBW2133714.1 RlmE family RNA methyltransferase [Deltaproteobacteria bacterium]